MKPHKPRLLEIPENVTHIQLLQSRGEALSPLQQEVLDAWKARGQSSALEAFTLRPWRRGAEIVFRDISLGALSKSHHLSCARRQQ